jgi:hypothetical protein
MRSRGILWKLMLAATLVVGCQSKPELPHFVRKMVDDHANPMIMVGNGAAYGVVLQRFAGGGGPR